MQRKQRTSKRRKKEMTKAGIRQPIGHGLDDNGLPFNRADEWNAKLPNKDARRQRRKFKRLVKDEAYE